MNRQLLSLKWEARENSCGSLKFGFASCVFGNQLHTKCCVSNLFQLKDVFRILIKYREGGGGRLLWGHALVAAIGGRLA